jgi:hypothetical protein
METNIIEVQSRAEQRCTPQQPHAVCVTECECVSALVSIVTVTVLQLLLSVVLCCYCTVTGRCYCTTIFIVSVTVVLLLLSVLLYAYT